VASDDDLLDPSEIEALLSQAGAGADPPAEQPASEPEAPASPASVDVPSDDGDSNLLDPSDIEALLQQGPAGATPPAETPPPPPAAASPAPQPAASPPAAMGGGAAEQLINEAEANLAAAIAPSLGETSGMSHDITGAAPLSLNDLAQSMGGAERSELAMLQDVELDLRIELGRTELMIEEVVALSTGSVVPLDKLAGDPVDILVNGRLIARGEVLVLNDNFCVRVSEILTPQV